MSMVPLALQLAGVTSRLPTGCVTPADEGVMVMDGVELRTPAQVRWYLDTGDWVDDSEIESTCGTVACIQHITVVQRHVSRVPPRLTLAALFRSGRSKGLFTGIRQYA